MALTSSLINEHIVTAAADVAIHGKQKIQERKEGISHSLCIYTQNTPSLDAYIGARDSREQEPKNIKKRDATQKELQLPVINADSVYLLFFLFLKGNLIHPSATSTSIEPSIHRERTYI